MLNPKIWVSFSYDICLLINYKVVFTPYSHYIVSTFYLKKKMLNVIEILLHCIQNLFDVLGGNF